MKALYINKASDLKDLDEIKGLILNNNSNYFLKKLSIKNIDIIRILIQYFKENYKNKFKEA